MLILHSATLLNSFIGLVEPNHSEQMQRRELEEPRTDFVFRKFGDVGKNESMIVTRGSYS